MWKWDWDVCPQTSYFVTKDCLLSAQILNLKNAFRRFQQWQGLGTVKLRKNPLTALLQPGADIAAVSLSPSVSINTSHHYDAPARARLDEHKNSGAFGHWGRAITGTFSVFFCTIGHFVRTFLVFSAFNFGSGSFVLCTSKAGHHYADVRHGERRQRSLKIK